MERQQRVMITPQILFHTHRELTARGIDVAGDVQWKMFDANGRLPNDQRISFLQSQSLLMRAIELSGDPDLGLAVGYRQSFASFGLVAAAMMASPTLREAVAVGLRFHRVVGTMLNFDSAELPGGNLMISMESRFAGSPIRRFLMQEAQISILTAARFLGGEKKAVVRVTTLFRPRDQRKFANMCGCPIDYAGDCQSLVLSRVALDAPNPLADPFAFREAQTTLAALANAEQLERDLLHAIEARILRTLPKVEGIADIAAAFGLSERSLRRRLDAAGTSFRDILQSVRLAQARQRLTEGQMTRDEIAWEIGFEDARSLRRLFRQEMSA
jgi:AraC-like DNA-binding protein